MLEANPGVDVHLPRSGSTLTIPQQLILPRHRARRDRDQRRRKCVSIITRRWATASKCCQSALAAGRETPRNWVTAVERKQEGPTWVPTANTRREYAKEGKTLPAMVPPGPIIRWDCMRSTLAGSTPSTVPTPTSVSGCVSAGVHPPAQRRY